jgi:hypothetical protein
MRVGQLNIIKLSQDKTNYLDLRDFCIAKLRSSLRLLIVSISIRIAGTGIVITS